MKNLVQLLLKQNHSQTPNFPSKKSGEGGKKSERDTTQIAIGLYDSAVQAVKRNHRLGRMPEYFNIQANIRQNIALQLTNLLSEVNLLETASYQAVQNAVQNWEPKKEGEQWKCDQVKDILLSLLPVVRQKQQLQKTCQDYQAYLKETIESGLSIQFPNAYNAYCTPHVELMPMRGQESQPQAVPAKDMDFFVAHQARLLSVQDAGLESAIQKYQSLVVLQRTLQSQKPAPAQLEDFRCQLRIHRETIEQRRDSAGMVFLKSVATILSFGIAALAGIWSVKGREVSKKMAQTLGSQFGGSIQTKTGSLFVH